MSGWYSPTGLSRNLDVNLHIYYQRCTNCHCKQKWAGNLTPTHRKTCGENSGNYQPVSHFHSWEDDKSLHSGLRSQSRWVNTGYCHITTMSFVKLDTAPLACWVFVGDALEINPLKSWKRECEWGNPEVY